MMSIRPINGNDWVNMKCAIRQIGLVGFFLLAIFPASAFECEIKVAVPATATLPDPVLAMSWTDKRFTTLVSDTLLRFDTSGSLQPWIAKRWFVSPDGLMLRFEIRSGVRFTDGTALKISDVQKSLQRWARDQQSIDRARLSVIDRIYADDENHLTIRLKRPFSPILYYFATPRAGIVKVSEGKIVGTGPWIPGAMNLDRVSFKANTNYFQGSPKCDRLELRRVNDSDIADAFRRGEIDVAEYVFAAGKTKMGIESELGKVATVSELPTYDVTSLYFTLNRKNSLSLAERRWIQSQLRSADFSGKNSLSRRACGILPIGLASSLQDYCVETQSDLPTKKPKQNLTIWAPNDERIQILHSVAENLRSAKVSTNVQTINLHDLFTEQARGKIAVHMETMTMQIPDPYGVLSMFVSSSDENFAHYANREFDKRVSTAIAESDPKKRDEQYTAALKILKDDAMIIPLLNESRLSIVRTSIEGHETKSLGPYYSDYHRLKKVESRK